MRIFGVEMTVRQGKKKKGIELLLIRLFSCSIAARNGVNFFCHALEGCRVPMLCAGEPEPPAGHCCGYPSKPPAMQHGPWNETEIWWVCISIIIEIPQTVTSPVKHTSNHDQHLYLQSCHFHTGITYAYCRTEWSPWTRIWSHYYPAANPTLFSHSRLLLWTCTRVTVIKLCLSACFQKNI